MHPEKTNGTNDAQIQALETRLGHRLPDDYRIFLKTRDEQPLVNRKFPIPECQDEAMLDIFLGVYGSNGIFYWLDEIGDELPEAYFPIGFDPGDNAIIMEATTGCVYYWDSARHFPDSTDEDNAYLIANSFSEFLDRLYC